MTMLSIAAMLLLCGPPAGADPPAAQQPVQVVAATARHDLPFHEQRTASTAAVDRITNTPLLRMPAGNRPPLVVMRNRFEIAAVFWYHDPARPLPQASLPPPDTWCFTLHHNDACVTQDIDGGTGRLCT